LVTGSAVAVRTPTKSEVNPMDAIIPKAEEPMSFEIDIKPMFRERDRHRMWPSRFRRAEDRQDDPRLHVAPFLIRIAPAH
jgi:hypothetical protein